MPGMAGRFFEEVAKNPAKIYDRLSVGRATQLVERGLRDHDVGLDARRTVTTTRSIDCRFVFSDVRSVLSCEAATQPKFLGIGHVVDQPQQRGARSDRRCGGLRVINSVQFLQQRTALVRKQRSEDGALVAG